jgi:F-type H+-transporting ATPase subunit delta
MINTGSNEVVRRYVKALHTLSLEQNKNIKIKNDFSLISELIEKNKEFKKIIFSPLVTPKKHQEILKIISNTLKMDQITENFLFLLAFNKRLILLEKILEFYNEISSKEKDITNIDIILPNKISKKEISSIQNKLKSEVKKKTKINFIEDKNIISGFVVKLGSTMIDFSIKSKLDKIINSLR